MKNLQSWKEVVGRCGGLPLAILHVGDLMSGRGESVTVQELSAVLEQISQYQTPWSESFANQESAEHLKEFLSYFRLFPRNFDIPVRRLITLLQRGWCKNVLTRKKRRNALQRIIYQI